MQSRKGQFNLSVTRP
nr:unnamed protein product [Callosobruchus chinensis]